MKLQSIKAAFNKKKKRKEKITRITWYVRKIRLELEFRHKLKEIKIRFCRCLKIIFKEIKD